MCAQVDVCLPPAIGMMPDVVAGAVVVTGDVALQVAAVEQGSALVQTAARWQRMDMTQVRSLVIIDN